MPGSGRHLGPVRGQWRCPWPTKRRARAAPADRAAVRSFEMVGKSASFAEPYWCLPRKVFYTEFEARKASSGRSLPSFLRHILNSQQDEGMPWLQFNAAGVEQHVSRSKAGKIMTHFEIVHPAVSRDNFLQQLA